MYIKFPTVKECQKEVYERDLASDKIESMSLEPLPFESNSDDIYYIVINMEEVVSYETGVVYHNSLKVDCIYLKFKNGTFSRNLLVDAKDFQRVFEIIKKAKVYTCAEIVESHG